MSKEFFDKVKSTVSTATEAISDVAQNFVEKNRTKAKLNRLRMVMKSESELMNRAYIELGKEYYELLKKGDLSSADEKQKNLMGVVDASKAKIAKARDCYRTILENQNDFVFASPSTQPKPEVKQEEVVDITVVCSNEDDYSTSPFDSCEAVVSEKAEEIVTAASDAADDAEDAAQELAESIPDEAEKLGEAVTAAESAADDSAPVSRTHFHKAMKEALDEEYPDDELF